MALTISPLQLKYYDVFLIALTMAPFDSWKYLEVLMIALRIAPLYAMKRYEVFLHLFLIQLLTAAQKILVEFYHELMIIKSGFRNL